VRPRTRHGGRDRRGPPGRVRHVHRDPRLLIRLSLILAALGVAAVLTGSAAAAGPPQRSIKVGDDFFAREGAAPAISVARGTRVTFRWKGSSLHNVHARTGPRTFRSTYKRRGTYSQVLGRAGTYRVYCDIHAPDMRITITVR
jgi:plastocyanin